MKIHIINLGCPKNSVDSEHLSGLLQAAGAEIVDSTEEADGAVVNTCGFIQPAGEESISVILDLETLKQQGALKKICVAGCLVNRYGDELKKELPLVDVWAGAEEWYSLARSLGLQPPELPARAPLPETTPWSRYLKVGEGCETLCAFCTIPSIRGRARSFPIADLAEAAVRLAEEGAREICLVGQDLTIYGRDIYGSPRLKELLCALDEELPPDVWIRMLYLHPSRIDERFIDFVAGSDRILSYL
ncbi:MAG: 30S ribosomal protein S12 methylthiotransferase RimO, partial [Synergistaceae bacterium]|nr:30S ribosomal protein S12 methylthiotransferase RimO [Synergistaceae bacterium]